MSAQQGLTPEFAFGFRAVMLDGITRELEITKKVLSAIPDSTATYRNDPNGRSAWELAWHLANTDVQFLDGIADMDFKMQTPADKPKTVAELVDWYDTNLKRAEDRVQALSAEQLLTPVNFMGAFNFPVVFFLGFMNNHCIHDAGPPALYLRPLGSKCLASYDCSSGK